MTVPREQAWLTYLPLPLQLLIYFREQGGSLPNIDANHDFTQIAGNLYNDKYKFSCELRDSDFYTYYYKVEWYPANNTVWMVSIKLECPNFLEKNTTEYLHYGWRSQYTSSIAIPERKQQFNWFFLKQTNIS